MQKKRKRNNVQNLFGAFQIPSDPQIGSILDKIDPILLSPIFLRALEAAERRKLLESYKVLGGGVLLALDGVWYFSSNNIHCPHCLHITKDGVTTYYHSMLAATMVRPGNNNVIPIMGEPIRNTDVPAPSKNGKEASYEKQKQDCEQKAMLRWLDLHADEYKFLKPTILGDDLYSKYPVCKKIIEKGLNFIFTCKSQTHKWLTECFNDSEIQVKEIHEYSKTLGCHIIRRYKWANKVEIRYDEPTMEVNFVDFTIEKEHNHEITYRNSFATNIEITEENVEHIVECGRARWKIENEHNNVLKNHGYHLEHNFIHGKEHASEIFCLLNFLALLFHTLLNLGDADYHVAKADAGRIDALFQEFRWAFRWYLFEDWQHFIHFIAFPPDDS
jgi:hypothetical protein